MELHVDFLYSQHTDVGGEICVRGAQQDVEFMLRVQRAIRDLPFRMHSGIGPTGPMNTDRVPRNFREGGFDDFLDGLAVGL